ncbi:MAG: MarR family transcriptional regulator [Propionibacteriaceae bacterium]|nr:MarR family transcriptional regulator [Propionibacteriaceae bacterium]
METKEYKLTEDESRIWRTWYFGFEYVETALNKALAKHGIDSNELRILTLLIETPDNRLRMSDVAYGANRSPSRLSHTVTRMELRELVVREPCADDRRGSWLVLTQKGEEVLQAALVERSKLVQEYFIDVIGQRDFAAIGRAMGKVLRANMPDYVRKISTPMEGWWPATR